MVSKSGSVFGGNGGVPRRYQFLMCSCFSFLQTTVPSSHSQQHAPHPPRRPPKRHPLALQNPQLSARRTAPTPSSEPSRKPANPALNNSFAIEPAKTSSSASAKSLRLHRHSPGQSDQNLSLLRIVYLKPLPAGIGYEKWTFEKSKAGESGEVLIC